MSVPRAQRTAALHFERPSSTGYLFGFDPSRDVSEQPRRGQFRLRLSLDHRRWRDRWRRRWLFRVRFQPNAGSLGRQKGLGIAGERPATRPSVIGNRVLGDNATVGINANLALDPVVSDLDNPADRSLGQLRRIHPLGVGYGLDESERVVGLGISAAHDMLAEMTLYGRQALVVPSLGFADYLCSCVAGCSIGGVTEGSGLGGEASLAQLDIRIGGRVDGKLIGRPIGVVEDLLKDARPAIAGTPDPAKTRNLLRLDRQLLELYASRGRAITIYTNRKAARNVNAETKSTTRRAWQVSRSSPTPSRLPISGPRLRSLVPMPSCARRASASRPAPYVTPPMLSQPTPAPTPMPKLSSGTTTA